MLPSFFISHGAPTLVLGKEPASTIFNLQKIGSQILEIHKQKPIRAILFVSAHWQASSFCITSSSKQEQIYDFHGFPQELYDIKVNVKGDPELASDIQKLLQKSGINSQLSSRGIDHGVWVPLVVMKISNIPILQLSLNQNMSFIDHIKLGEALKPLREEIIIITSGGAVHNLRHVFSNLHADAATEDWALKFDDALCTALTMSNPKENLHKLIGHPDMSKAHPTHEHLMPAYVFSGLLNETENVTQASKEICYGSLSYSCYSTA